MIGIAYYQAILLFSTFSFVYKAQDPWDFEVERGIPVLEEDYLQ